MKAQKRNPKSTPPWSSPFWLRVRFCVWYAYPLLILGLIAFVGKQAVERVNRASNPPTADGAVAAVGAPLDTSERAELLDRFLKESGSLEDWIRYGASNRVSAGGWIMHRQAYRIFEATKLEDDVEVNFPAQTESYAGRFAEGILEPQEDRANPNDDPMAEAVSILLDSYGDGNFCHQMLEALQSAPLETSFWNGRPAIELSFHCSDEDMDVVLTFERSEMLLRERSDTYDTGLVVKKTFHGYRTVGGLALPDEIVMTIDNRGPYQFGISTLSVETEPMQVAEDSTGQ